MSTVINEEEVPDFSHLIAKSSLETAKKFFYQAIDLFCGQEKPEYKDYSDTWTLFEWWDILDSSQKFLKTVKSNEAEFTEHLAQLTPEYQAVISECLEVRSADIEEALIQKTCEISSAFLKDYDWKLKMTLASDKMAQINEPRLALDFDIQEGNTNKVLSLDMSKEDVKQLIDALEAATKDISDLKV